MRITIKGMVINTVFLVSTQMTIRVSTTSQQQAHKILMSFSHSPHQGGTLSFDGCCIYVSTIVEAQSNNIEIVDDG